MSADLLTDRRGPPTVDGLRHDVSHGLRAADVDNVLALLTPVCLDARMDTPTAVADPLDGYRRTEAEFPELAEHATFSTAWYMAWRDLHLARYPEADAATRANLDMFVSMAQERAAITAQYVDEWVDLGGEA
jgi:hypothetical protein